MLITHSNSIKETLALYKENIKEEREQESSERAMMSSVHKRRRINNNNNTVKIDDIEDLLKEIFFRLPPISVLTFKRVSKRWYSLISNPQFLRIHSLRFHCNAKHHHRIDLLMPGLFFKPCSYLLPNYHSQFLPLFPHQYQDFPRLDFLDPTYSVLPRTDLYPLGMGSWFMLTDSCNGLLLYQTYSETPTYFVCNPITKQYVELPKLQQHEYLTYSCNPHLVFDPSSSLSYKVVKFSLHQGSTPNSYYQLYVYSSVTGSWKPSKKVNAIPNVNVNDRTVLLNGDDRTVLLNGVLYWNWRTTDGDHMVCFDVENETVWYLSLPPKPTGCIRKWLYFGECGGKLRLIVKWITSLNFSKLTFPCSFDIFEAEESKLPPKQNLASDIWVVRYRVVNMFGFDRMVKQPFDVHILHHYKTGSKEKDEALLMNIDGRIFSYNLSCCAFGKELIIPFSRPFYEYTDVFPYIATLFPLR